MTDCDLDTSVPDWVIEHPISLRLFQQLGLDYHCGGKSLLYACEQQRLDPKDVLKKLLQMLREEALDK